MGNKLWFIKQSLILDFKFLKTSDWNIRKKIDFIFLKYFLIFKHLLKKFKLGEDFFYFDNKKIYYDSRFGLIDYQSILSKHQNLIKLAGIKNVSTVVDIGANVGFFSRLCRDIFPESKIFSIEPIPRTFECLYKNFKDDRNTKIFNLAISDFNGRVKMNFNDQNSAGSQITNDGDIEVAVKKLDDFAGRNNINHIDILKIDTETFEAHVLRGGFNSLSKTKYLFIEINTWESNHNYTLSSLLKLLSTESFDFQLVGFINYNDSEGCMPLIDVLLKNIKI